MIRACIGLLVLEQRIGQIQTRGEMLFSSCSFQPRFGMTLDVSEDSVDSSVHGNDLKNRSRISSMSENRQVVQKGRSRHKKVRFLYIGKRTNSPQTPSMQLGIPTQDSSSPDHPSWQRATFNNNHQTRHKTMPPIFLSTHSLASMIPLSVLTKMHSPTCLKPLTNFASFPLTISPNSPLLSHMRLVGLDSSFIFLSTGSPSQYFMPSHSLLEARFCCVTSSTSSTMLFCCGVVCAAMGSSTCAGGSSFCGGVGPPRVTVERNPCFWRRSDSDRCIRESGIEVRPRRARDAFCMCEQTWARLTRDMAVE